MGYIFSHFTMQRHHPSSIEAEILKVYGRQYFEAQQGSLNRNEIAKKALMEINKIPNIKIEWTKEKIIKWFHNNEETIKQRSNKRQMKHESIPPEWSDPYYIGNHLSLLDQKKKKNAIRISLLIVVRAISDT